MFIERIKLQNRSRNEYKILTYGLTKKSRRARAELVVRLTTGDETYNARKRPARFKSTPLTRALKAAMIISCLLSFLSLWFIPVAVTLGIIFINIAGASDFTTPPATVIDGMLYCLIYLSFWVGPLYWPAFIFAIGFIILLGVKSVREDRKRNAEWKDLMRYGVFSDVFRKYPNQNPRNN